MRYVYIPCIPQKSIGNNCYAFLFTKWLPPAQFKDTQSSVSMYSVSSYFRLELVEPSAREVEGQHSLSHVLFSSPNSPPLYFLDQSPKIKYFYSRRLYKLQAKISGQAVDRYIDRYRVSQRRRPILRNEKYALPSSVLRDQ